MTESTLGIESSEYCYLWIRFIKRFSPVILPNLCCGATERNALFNIKFIIKQPHGKYILYESKDNLWGSEKSKDEHRQRERSTACETDGWHKSDHVKCSDSVNRELLCKSDYLLSLLTASLPLSIHSFIPGCVCTLNSAPTPQLQLFIHSWCTLSLSLNYIWPLSCISRQQANVSAPPPHTSISLCLSDSSCYFSPSLVFRVSLSESIDRRAWLWFFIFLVPSCLFVILLHLLLFFFLPLNHTHAAIATVSFLPLLFYNSSFAASYISP